MVLNGFAILLLFLVYVNIISFFPSRSSFSLCNSKSSLMPFFVNPGFAAATVPVKLAKVEKQPSDVFYEKRCS